MKHKIYIIVIEDELEVMEALISDLEVFESHFPIESANNAEEAKEVIFNIINQGDKVGLLLADHILPGQNGVDLLIELHEKDPTRISKKILVTGQASHHDTIQAVNHAGLNQYIAKPWTKEQLENAVRKELTDFVIKHEKDYFSYMPILDTEKISEAIRENHLTDH